MGAGGGAVQKVDGRRTKKPGVRLHQQLAYELKSAYRSRISPNAAEKIADGEEAEEEVIPGEKMGRRTVSRQETQLNESYD